MMQKSFTEQIFGGNFQAKSGMDTVKCVQIFVVNLVQISTGQLSPLKLTPFILKYLLAPDFVDPEMCSRKVFRKHVTETRADVSLLPPLQ